MGLVELCKWLLGSAVFLALAACGGGSGIQTASILAPPAIPTPGPPPTPTALTPLAILPGITASTQFATLGVASNDSKPPSLTTDGFAVSYDATARAYLVQVPSNGAGTLLGQTSTSDFGQVQAAGGVFLYDVTVVGPATAGLQLSYTALFAYKKGSSDPNIPGPFGWVAFGKATSLGTVPISGTATYSAVIQGSTLDRFSVRGSASLQFDFAAGKLSGHLDPILTDPTGLGFNDTAFARYDFVNTVYSAGSTIFSGQLSTPGISQPGSFDGLFTGPAAEELMARWSAPAINPITNQSTQIFGALVGKRP